MIIKGKNCSVEAFSNFSVDPYSLYGPTDFATGNQFFRFGKEYNPIFIGTPPNQAIKYVLS